MSSWATLIVPYCLVAVGGLALPPRMPSSTATKGRRGFALIHVASVTPVAAHLGDIVAGAIVAESAVCDNNLVEGVIDIFRHTRGIAADGEVGALVEPLPKLRAVFEHFVLNVNFFGLVA